MSVVGGDLDAGGGDAEPVGDAGGGQEAEVSVQEEIKNGSNSVYLHLMQSLRSQV